MLTPKHRALFAAAYSSQLLRSTNDDNELPPASALPPEPPVTRNDEPGREPEHR